MKKYLLIGGLSMVVVLGACGNETDAVDTNQIDELEEENAALLEENEDLQNQLDEVENQEESAQETSEDTETELEESNEVEDESLDINEVIADDDDMHIELVSIEHTFDEMWDEERINVNFEIENKSETSKEIQTRSLSIDNRMVDEMIYNMSQEVEQGKSAQAVLTLEDYESNDLPELTGNLEMEVIVFDWDDMDAEDLSYDVNINLDDY